MIRLYYGSDTYTLISNIKLLEDAGYKPFYSDLQSLQNILSSNSLFDTAAKKFIVNFDSAEISISKSFFDLINKHKSTDIDIIFFYFGTPRVGKKELSYFGRVEKYNIKDNKEVFDFIDAVFSKKEKKSLELSNNLLGKMHETYLLSLLYYQVKNLNYYFFDTNSFLKLHPYVGGKTKSIAQNYSKKKMISLNTVFSEADYKIKNSSSSNDVFFSLIYYILAL